MLNLIKLSDTEIINFQDDDETCIVWCNSFNPSEEVNVKKFTIDFSDGRSVNLSSPLFDSYSTPSGFVEVSNLTFSILSGVANDKFKERTSVDFIDFMLRLADGPVKLEYMKDKNTYSGIVFDTGFNQRYISMLIENNYIKKREEFEVLEDKFQLISSEEQEHRGLLVITEDKNVKTLDDFLK